MENRKMVSFPECILCKTSFKVTGPTPFLLPCLHAVCDRCMKSAAKELECPCCPKHRDNQETKLKVDKVRKEFVLHMTAKYHPSELLCNHEEDGNQAVTWCIDCQELFCEFCYNLHSGFKALKGHVFKSLGELSEGKAGLSSASEKEKGVMKVFQDLKETCEKKIQQTESNLSALQTSGELQMEQISQTFEMLRSLLDQREKEVKLHFESKQQESLTLLRRDGKVLRKIITFCRGILEYDQMASTVWVPDDDMKYNDPLKKTQLYSSHISKISGKQSQSIKFETKDLQLLRKIICGFAKISNETKINCDKPATQKEIHQKLTWTCRRCRYQNNTDTVTCSTCKGQVKDNAHIAITMAPTGAMATGVMKEEVKAFQFEAAESGCEKKGLVGRGETKTPPNTNVSSQKPMVQAQIFSPTSGMQPHAGYSTRILGAPSKTGLSSPLQAGAVQAGLSKPMPKDRSIFSTVGCSSLPAQSSFATPSTGVPAQSSFATPSTGTPTQSSFATPSTGAPAQRSFATPSNVPAESCFVIPSTAAPALSNFMTPSTRVPAQSSCSTPSTGVPAQISSMSPSTGVSAQSSSMTPSSATTGFLKNVSSPSTQKFLSTPSAVLVQSSLLTPKKVANGKNGHSKTKHSVPQRDSTFRQQSEQAGFLFDRNVSSTSKFDFATKPAEETAGFKFTNPFTELKEEKGLTFNFGHADNDTVSKTDGAGCVPSVQN